jgi:hypothetical protein
MPDAFNARSASGAAAKVGAGDLNARLIPWIEAHAGDRFFVYIQSVDPHPPFIAPGAESAGDPLSTYHAAIAYNDREIGRLSRRLADLGLSSRTLFVVTADHGEAFGEHGRTGHGQSAYEEEVRVPLIVSWPGTVGGAPDLSRGASESPRGIPRPAWRAGRPRPRDGGTTPAPHPVARGARAAARAGVRPLAVLTRRNLNE